MEDKKKELELLYKDLDSLNQEYKRIENESAQKGLSWEEMCEKARINREKAFLDDKKIRLLEEPSIDYIERTKGTLLPFNDFVENCKSGLYTDTDGYGYYASEKATSDIKIYPSDILYNLYRTDFSHVRWFTN